MCVTGTSRRVPGPPTFLAEGTIALAFERFAHRIAAGHVPEGAVFQFARRPDDRSLAVAFYHVRIAAERRHEILRHLQPSGFRSSMKPAISST